VSYTCCFEKLLTKFLLSYRKKKLRNETVKFIEAVRRSMGVHCVVLQGYKRGDDVNAM